MGSPFSCWVVYEMFMCSNPQKKIEHHFFLSFLGVVNHTWSSNSFPYDKYIYICSHQPSAVRHPSAMRWVPKTCPSYNVAMANLPWETQAFLMGWFARSSAVPVCLDDSPTKSQDVQRISGNINGFPKVDSWFIVLSFLDSVLVFFDNTIVWN